MRINPKLIELWTRAAKQYHESLAGSPAEAYLKERGILDGASRFMLGYVAEVAPGHEDRIKNHLSIPYITEGHVARYNELHQEWMKYKNEMESLMKTDIAGLNELIKTLKVDHVMLPE